MNRRLKLAVLLAFLMVGGIYGCGYLTCWFREWEVAPWWCAPTICVAFGTTVFIGILAVAVFLGWVSDQDL